MKFILTFFLILFCVSILFAGDDLRTRANTDPLDCALYIRSIDEYAMKGETLDRGLFDAGRYDELLSAINLEKNSYTRFWELAGYGTKILDVRNTKFALKFSQRAFEVLKTDEQWEHRDSRLLVALFIRLDREANVREIINHQSDDQTKTRLALAVAETYLTLGNIKRATTWLNTANKSLASLEYLDDLFPIADLYLKRGLTKNALAVAFMLEDRAAKETNSDKQTAIVLRNIPLLIKLGESDKANSYWERFGSEASFDETLAYASALAKSGDAKRSDELFQRLENDQHGLLSSGQRLVHVYFEKGDIENATRLARSISSDDDSYGQQEALMVLADDLIRSDKRARAIEILDFAFERARRISYEHRPQDSVGASSGSRKGIYLGNISKRLIKLGLYDKAFTVALAIKADHDRARQSLAETLVNFAKLRTRALPKNEIYKLLKDAADLVAGSDYETLDIKVRSAEVFALLNEKEKAVDLLAKVITDSIDTCCYEDDLLVTAGRVFVQYRLKANANMRGSLKSILENHRQ